MAGKETSARPGLRRSMAALATMGLVLSLGTVAEAAPSAKLTQYKIPRESLIIEVFDALVSSIVVGVGHRAR